MIITNVRPESPTADVMRNTALYLSSLNILYDN